MERLVTPARVLLVMGQALSSLAGFALSRGPFVTRATASAGEARKLLASWQPEIYIVDIDEPGGRALALLDGRPSNAPFIALTKKRDARSRLAAFERGADDVLSLPVDPEELLARALALARRAYGRPMSFQPTITAGDIRIDVARGTASLGGNDVRLTPIELRLLYVLAAAAGETLSRQRILDILWGVDFVADSNVIDRHIRNLRAKLGDDWRRPRVIRTVPRMGYVLVTNGGARAIRSGNGGRKSKRT